MKLIIAYIPVLHKGYLDFLQRHVSDGNVCLIPNITAIELIEYLKKDIRALSENDICSALKAIFLGKVSVVVWSKMLFHNFQFKYEIIMPDEDISRAFAEKYLSGCAVNFDPVFLRWDRQRVNAHVDPVGDYQVTTDHFFREVIGLAEKEAQKSKDWWRQVGAVLLKDDEILLCGFNRHVPTDDEPNILGDPRMIFHKGEMIELSTALHAEAGIIAESARLGLSLLGTDLFVTTFPCPPCAKMIAFSGIKRLFFKEGYAMLDGVDILKAKGVEIIKVV